MLRRLPARLPLAGVTTVELWLGASTIYLLTLLGLARTQAGRRPAPPPAPRARRFNMAVLVPAHNEAAGIAPTVGALRAQAYPADRFEVIVVADNCTDATASRASAAGATVWSREDPSARGKGQALAWAIERLWRERPDIEAVAVVDADCHASPNLLATFDLHLRTGAHAVQAAYDAANPEDSTASALRYAGFALMHRVRPRGRRRLGLSADLFGTGMAFSASVLRAHPWRSFGVTEDAEFHIDLLRAGVSVAFAESASVASPMPTSNRRAREQQLRWESGNAALARRTVGPLVRAGLSRRDGKLLHAGLEQLVPPQTVLLAGTAAALAGSVALRRPWLVAAAATTAAGQVLYVLAGLRVAGAPPAVFKALPRAPALVAAKLPLFGRIGFGHGALVWTRTQREA